MHGDYMTCMEMCLIGAGTGMEIILQVIRQIILDRSMAAAACYAAGVGTIIPLVRRTGAAAIPAPAAGSTLSASVLFAPSERKDSRYQNFIV